MKKPGSDRICLIIPGMDAGGIENYVLRYLNYTTQVPLITVMVRSNAEGDLFPKYLSTGVEIRRQGVSYFNILKWYKLYRFFKENKFRTICDFNENFSGIPIFIAWLAGVPTRIAFYRRSSHAFKINRLNLSYAFLMNLLVYRFSTAILSNSKHAFDFFFDGRYLNDHRFKVIPNGVEASKFNCTESKEQARTQLGLPLGAFIVGHSGRFDPAKNHETFFKTSKILSDKYPDIRFMFCGKDTDGAKFRERLQWHKIEQKTITLGLREDVPLVLRSMDVFYFPSVTEGQPNSLIEAMLAGIPVIASNIKPIKEALPKSFHASLVEPLDCGQAVSAIENYYHRMAEDQGGSLQTWAAEKFDIQINFKLFENELK